MNILAGWIVALVIVLVIVFGAIVNTVVNDRDCVPGGLSGNR